MIEIIFSYLLPFVLSGLSVAFFNMLFTRDRRREFLADISKPFVKLRKPFRRKSYEEYTPHDYCDDAIKDAYKQKVFKKFVRMSIRHFFLVTVCVVFLFSINYRVIPQRIFSDKLNLTEFFTNTALCLLVTGIYFLSLCYWYISKD